MINGENLGKSERKFFGQNFWKKFVSGKNTRTDLTGKLQKFNCKSQCIKLCACLCVLGLIEASSGKLINVNEGSEFIIICIMSTFERRFSVSFIHLNRMMSFVETTLILHVLGYNTRMHFSL